MTSIDPDQLKILMAAVESTKEEMAKEFPEEKKTPRADALMAAYRLFRDGSEERLKVGGLAVWKDGLKNRKRPMYGEPAVVIQIAGNEEDAHIDPGNDSGSSYYREPLNVQLGVLDEDGDLSLFYFDKRRFRPFGA